MLGYYLQRADLRRSAQVIESLRSASELRPWIRPMVEAESGVLAWFRGEFDDARSHLEQATAAVAEADLPKIEAMLFMPGDPFPHVQLSLARKPR